MARKFEEWTQAYLWLQEFFDYHQRNLKLVNKYPGESTEDAIAYSLRDLLDLVEECSKVLFPDGPQVDTGRVLQKFKGVQNNFKGLQKKQHMPAEERRQLEQFRRN
ncbi:MAG: hypothetical protein QF775_02200 [archaeon]|jgi:hypothetical protein|nr:hypothetical protein [Euryarchaeota archaeon]MDP6704276.1 hypothetical protein [archaeon]HIK01265.1 hypothetical protein [Candidatus Undinarchaeales archaeon ERR594346 U_76725]|tara:strand:- start:25746 stop:26063 length:318 start_codon:yes stop_codon:yes gene_type:complete